MRNMQTDVPVVDDWAPKTPQLMIWSSVQPPDGAVYGLTRRHPPYAVAIYGGRTELDPHREALALPEACICKSRALPSVSTGRPFRSFRGSARDDRCSLWWTEYSDSSGFSASLNSAICEYYAQLLCL